MNSVLVGFVHQLVSIPRSQLSFDYLLKRVVKTYHVVLTFWNTNLRSNYTLNFLQDTANIYVQSRFYVRKSITGTKRWGNYSNCIWHQPSFFYHLRWISFGSPQKSDSILIFNWYSCGWKNILYRLAETKDVRENINAYR